MKIITTAVIKGGTGKTTTAAALAQAAAAEGKRVLIIDLDAQGNLSYTVGADPNGAGSYELLHGASAADVIQHTAQEIDAITASPNLATEKTTPGSAKRLQEAIKPLKRKYDYIFIDTPPTMNELTFNALQASTGLIIPLETDSNSLQGLYRIIEIAQQIKESNPQLKVLGVILTSYDNRPKLHRYLREVIKEKAQEMGAPYLMEIRSGVVIREAQALQQSIYKYAPKSKPAQDYKKLFEMI